MRAYVCYKVDWEDTNIFYVTTGTTKPSFLISQIVEEYKLDQSKYDDDFEYYVEEWQARERVARYKFIKDGETLEPYVNC